MKNIKNNLDLLWRKAVYKRAKGRCELCSSPKGVDCHHIFGRSKSVRYELENGILLCRLCHIKAHRNVKKFRKDYGTERMAKLHRKIVKDVDYKEIEEKLIG